MTQELLPVTADEVPLFSDEELMKIDKSSGPNGVPVSYTHLDVYKRQL